MTTPELDLLEDIAMALIARCRAAEAARAREFEERMRDERNYILPVFAWAKEMGCDLPALVAEANGNCVERFFGWLRERIRAAEAERTRWMTYSEVAEKTMTSLIRERDSLREQIDACTASRERARAEAAEARVRELEAERSGWAGDTNRAISVIEEQRAENATLRAVAEAARAHLRVFDADQGPHRDVAARDALRAALAALPEVPR